MVPVVHFVIFLPQSYAEFFAESAESVFKRKQM